VNEQAAVVDRLPGHAWDNASMARREEWNLWLDLRDARSAIKAELEKEQSDG
jgi:hypothetical protein